MEVEDRREWTRPEPLYPIVIRLFGAVLRLLFDVRFGGHSLPRTGPAIIAANHAHRLDAVVFGWIAFTQGRKTRFLALADLWNVFGLRWLLRNGRMIAVHRGAGPFRMVQDARAALDAGEVVLIYPEGHLVPGRDDLPAQPGTGLLALTGDAPIIPMALWGLRSDQRYRRTVRRRIGVAAGDPVDVSEWRGRTDEQASRAAADAVLAAVRAQIPRAERLARGVHGSKEAAGVQRRRPMSTRWKGRSAMADKPGNQTPNTPDVSESELRDMKVDELREEAKDAGVSGTSSMKKDDLVEAVAEAGSGSGESDEVGAGPEGGKLRIGDETSSSLKYSQEVTSPDEEPERAGRSLATTHHEVIKQWAEERNAVPATVAGTEHGDHLGVLRFDFGGDNEDLRHVSWDEWFETFDARDLNFIYQEERSDGQQSNFFRLESPHREDA